MMTSNGDDYSDFPAFIAADTWQGSKPGYVFRNSKENGTGYHIDSHQLKKAKLMQQAGSKHKLASEVERPSAKRAKRSVGFAEEKNEVREIPNASELLKQAEEAAENTKILDLTSKGVQLGIKSLKRAQEKNQILRAQHPDDPEQYMDSEVALYEAITALQPIAADAPNLYPPLIESSHYDSPEELWTTTFSQLCMHENTDVVSSVVALLLELVDPTLLEMDQPNQHPNNRPLILVGQAVMDYLIELLVANLARLQQQQEASEEIGIGKGLEDVLSLIENLLEMDLSIQNNNYPLGGGDQEPIHLVSSGGSVAGKLAHDTPFLSWLFTQIRDNTASKDRSLELLAFLVQREEVHTVHPDWSKLPLYKSVFEQEEDDRKNGDKKQSVKAEKEMVLDGMEILLVHGIAPFRKKQPANDVEVEALENACIAVEAAIMFSPINVQAFLDGQGIELVLRCLKEKVHSGGVTLKLLDFSGNDSVYEKACEHLVANAGGLKYLFPLFMGRQIPKPAIMSWTDNNDNKKKKSNNAVLKAKKEWIHMIETQTIRILYALTRHLTDESPADAKKRLLAKFVEEDKCDRLVELCLAYDEKARLAEFKFWKSDVEEEIKDEEAIQLAALEAKLSGGGDIFHRLGAMAGFCCFGSKRCHERILSQLSLQKSGIAVIKAALEEFMAVLGPGKQSEQLKTYNDAI